MDLESFVSEWKPRDHNPVSLDEFIEKCPGNPAREEVINLLDDYGYDVDRFTDTFQMSMDLYMVTFNITDTVFCSVGPEELLKCTNESDVAETIPGFKPGTRYEIHAMTQSEIRKLNDIINADDSSLCRCFFDIRDDTVFLCFKGIDPKTFEKVHKTMKQWAREKSEINAEIYEDEIEEMAIAFIQKCLYF